MWCRAPSFGGEIFFIWLLFSKNCLPFHCRVCCLDRSWSKGCDHLSLLILFLCFGCAALLLLQPMLLLRSAVTMTWTRVAKAASCPQKEECRPFPLSGKSFAKVGQGCFTTVTIIRGIFIILMMPAAVACFASFRPYPSGGSTANDAGGKLSFDEKQKNTLSSEN